MRHDECTGHFKDCEHCKKLGTTACGNDWDCTCFEGKENEDGSDIERR